jgi:tripeptidyl-peptidase I
VVVPQDDYATMNSDLAAFAKKYRPDATPQPVKLTTVGSATATPTGHGDLSGDVVAEWLFAIAPKATVEFLLVPGDTLASIDQAVTALEQRPQGPDVLLMPTALAEPEVIKANAVRLCADLTHLSSGGTTVVAPSGDDGVAGRPDGATFAADSPATCPEVTAVGATTSFGPEVGASLSGGGFSNFFDRPAYQNTSVNGYLNALGNTYSGRFKPSGRAIPNVAAQGNAMPITNGGATTLISGTDVSAAVWAGVIADLDSELKSADKPTLCTANPFLYGKGASTFNDITSGSNPGAGTSGFSAAPGWDPVTGLGTPDYPALRAVAGL